METVTSEVTTRELRRNLADVLGRTMYAGERIGVTRNGKLAAVLVSVSDLEALEAFADAQDVAAYRAAKAQDDDQTPASGANPGARCDCPIGQRPTSAWVAKPGH